MTTVGLDPAGEAYYWQNNDDFLFNRIGEINEDWPFGHEDVCCG